MKIIDLRRFKVKWLIYFVLFYSLFFRFATDYLHIPSSSRYVIDFCLLCACVVFLKGKNKFRQTQKVICIFIVLYYVYCFITYFLNYQSLIYLAYGTVFRFRYYLFTILCMALLDKTDAKRLLNALCKLFYINALIIVYQYFVEHLRGDYLGGIFGNIRGCNGYLNIFLICVITIEVFHYLNSSWVQKRKPYSLMLKLFIAVLIAAVAELKFFFVEVIVLLIFAVIFTGFSWKKLFITLLVSSGLAIGFSVFSIVYTYGADFLDLNLWIELASSGAYSSGYSGTGEVNRLTFASVISDRFFTSETKKLFGMGLGNCSNSSISIFNTPFYETYGRIRYDWFTSSATLLEQGWLGMCFYVGFFLLIFYLAGKAKKNAGEDLLFCYMSQALSVISVMLMLYNNSMTLESGFIVYFILTIPFFAREQRLDACQ